ncbi:hypothetical protein CE91St19_21620 [Odoribacter laneus]|nr:hypothetical protein CE91St19_21620 [Odoribacter laneus]GKI25203.1 hypothetical protein CE91St20_13400 [Odoribacter laneus]
MAELDLRQDTSNIYSNVEDNEALPLFVRFTSDDVKFHNKDAVVQFEEIVAKLRGIHQCCFIHRRQKGRTKTYEELAVKFDDLPICMTAQQARDGFTLRVPHFTEKNMVLPEEGEYIIRKCDVKFVDLYEDSFKLISGAGTYWLGHVDELSQFITDCFSLPIPPIEIQIEEDKAMWQAYLDGLNAILENKRDLIRVQSVSKQKGGLLRLDFDMESYAQNLKNAIYEELNGKCDQKVQINIEDGECLISFDGYQPISDETIDNIKTIGRDYCYTAEATPINTVSGSISIVSNKDELNEIFAFIDKELLDFDEDINKDENGEFHLNNDKSIEILNAIIDKYRGIATVVNTTKIIMPLLPAEESINIDILKGNLPEQAQIKPYGKHFVVSSKKPLDIDLDIFRNMRFSSCMVNISPSQIDTNIQIEGATIKGSAYSWIINDRNELKNAGRLFNEVRKRYEGYVNSTFFYAFAPQIDKSILQELKLKYYSNPSIVVDVPRSCVIFYPKSKENYDSIKDLFFESLASSINATAPEYAPTAKIDFLCENEEYRRSVFEKVNIALSDKRGKFIKNKLSRDVKQLIFEFTFEDIDERDEIEKILQEAISAIHGVKIVYDDGNSKGITNWSLVEDPSLLQDLDRKLQSDFLNETVNYINGKEYDKLSDVDEEELNSSHYSKATIVRRRKKAYLKSNSYILGTCTRRCRDYTIIDVDDEMMETMRSNEFQISAGDYIQFPAMGETMELMRQSVAMNRILKPANKYNQNPINLNLPNFIFDPKYASETVVNIEEAKEDIRAHKIGTLNEKQLEAVTKSVLAKDLALIQGPPGTGKTTVIAEIIWQEIRRNPECRILLTSQTNLAVDNALERLQGQAGIRPVRIGKPEKLEPEGRRFSLPIIRSWTEGKETYSVREDLVLDTADNATKIWIDRIANKVSNNPKYADAVCAWKKELLEKDKHSRTEFSQLYRNNVNLIAATCSICGSPDFYYSYVDMFGEYNRNNMFFDVVIMDEASKATPLEMAVPLVLGKKIIVIGDHKQLPPMMDENTIDSALEKIGRKDLAEKLQKAESQFKRLFEAAAKVRKTVVATLDTQYRMHEQIMNTIKQFYQEELAATGGLKCGIIETMDIPDLKNKGSRWHGISINPIIRPNTHAVWIDVKSPETALNPGFRNDGELKAIDLVLRALEQADGYKEFQNSQTKPEDKEIGIITFYSAQSREIKKKYKGRAYRIDVVDRFQGMERNIVIVSTVRSNAKNNIGFAKEIERINVAFSRARRLLIVVGNKRQFESNNNYAASIANMETVSVEQLRDAVR